MVNVSKFLKTKNEHYYSSHLNKFIDENCSHEMYCINIDCLIVKISKQRIRLIEAKQDNEFTPKSEISCLKILRYLLGNVPNNPYKIDFWLVHASEPFEKNLVTPVGGDETNSHTLTKKELIEWLNFEREIE